MSDFLTINGIRIEVEVLSAGRNLEPKGELALSGSGEVLDQRRQNRTRITATTICASKREARALQALIEGYAHVLNLDGDLCASTSLAPSSIAPSGTLIMYADGGWAGGRVRIIGGESLDYAEAVVGGEEWIVFARHYAVDDEVPSHIALRSDGAVFVDGVRVVSPANFPITYANGPDSIRLRGFDVQGNNADVEFSSVAIFKAWAPDEWVTQQAGWDAVWGPAPIIHAEGTVIDSPLGIYANGRVTDGRYIQRGGFSARDTHPQDETWENNAVQLTFELVEDDRPPGVDLAPFAELYAPLTERVGVDSSGIAVVVTDNGKNGTLVDVATLIDPPAGDEQWPLWVSGAGLSMIFSGAPNCIVDPGVESRFSVSAWLYIPSGTPDGDLFGVDEGTSGNREWVIGLSGGSLFFRTYDDSVPATVTTTIFAAVQTDEWFHVVAVHDSNGVAAGVQETRTSALFINGEQPASAQGVSGSFVAIEDSGIELGAPDSVPSAGIAIGLCHLAGFDLRALTRAQIRTLYRLGRRGFWLRRV